MYFSFGTDLSLDQSVRRAAPSPARSEPGQVIHRRSWQLYNGIFWNFKATTMRYVQPQATSKEYLRRIRPW